MTKEDLRKSLLKQFPELRPSLVKYFHDEKVREYKELYLQNNKKNVTREKLVLFNQKLLEKQVGIMEADSLIEGIVSEMFRIIGKQRRKYRVFLTIVNTIVFVMILGTAISYIILYLKHIGIDILNNYDLLNIPNLINAVIIILISTGYYVLSVFRKS